MHTSIQKNQIAETPTLLDKYPMFCYHCDKPVKADNYRVIGLNIYGWPIKLPQSIVVHKDCQTAEDVVRYKLRCLHCQEWFSSVEANKRFCGFQCEHDYWSVRQPPVVNEYKPSVTATPEVKAFMDALKSKTEAKKEEAPAITPIPADEVIVSGNNPLVQRIPQVYENPVITFVPHNEQGVIFLFGSAIVDIGYRMLDIRIRYPDATMISPDDMKIEVEFEYRSSNFVTHKHNPLACHLVICWINDTDLPVPTIALSDHYDISNGVWNFNGLNA